MKQKVTLIVTAAVSSFVLIGLGEIAFSSLGPANFFLPIETPKPFPSVHIEAPAKQVLAIAPALPTIEPFQALPVPLAFTTTPADARANDTATGAIGAKTEADSPAANNLVTDGPVAVTMNDSNARPALVSYKPRTVVPVLPQSQSPVTAPANKPTGGPPITKPADPPPNNPPSDKPTVNRPKDETPEHQPRDDQHENKPQEDTSTHRPKEDSSGRETGGDSHVTRSDDNTAPAREHEDHH